MILTILGSGTPVPLLERSNAAYLLEINNKKLLFDSGAGTIRRLLELKINLIDINHIFYTHLHNDHINDLGAIIWSNNYGVIRDIPLNLYGPNGFKKYFKILLKKLLKPEKLYFDITIKELKNTIIKIGDITIKTYKTVHSSTTKSIIYRIEYKNKSFVYTGDTEYCNEAIEAARNADVLLAECTCIDNKKVEGHLTPSLAGKLAAKANAKLLILTHFSPAVLKAPIEQLSGNEFKGKIILARDKISIHI